MTLIKKIGAITSLIIALGALIGAVAVVFGKGTELYDNVEEFVYRIFPGAAYEDSMDGDTSYYTGRCDEEHISSNGDDEASAPHHDKICEWSSPTHFFGPTIEDYTKIYWRVRSKKAETKKELECSCVGRITDKRYDFKNHKFEDDQDQATKTGSGVIQTGSGTYIHINDYNEYKGDADKQKPETKVETKVETKTPPEAKDIPIYLLSRCFSNKEPHKAAHISLQEFSAGDPQIDIFGNVGRQAECRVLVSEDGSYQAKLVEEGVERLSLTSTLSGSSSIYGKKSTYTTEVQKVNFREFRGSQDGVDSITLFYEDYTSGGVCGLVLNAEKNDDKISHALTITDCRKYEGGIVGTYHSNTCPNNLKDEDGYFYVNVRAKTGRYRRLQEGEYKTRVKEEIFRNLEGPITKTSKVRKWKLSQGKLSLETAIQKSSACIGENVFTGME